MRPHRYQCPKCKEPATITSYRDEYNVAKCTICEHTFRAYHQKRTGERWERRTQSGSGVIAGRIEIGRGFNWKAGIV